MILISGVYLTCTMAITTLAMVATVFVLNLYQNSDKPVPRWAKKLFIVYLSRALCMCACLSPPNEKHGRTDPHVTHNHLHKDKVRFRIKYTPVSDRSDQEDTVEILSVESQSPDVTRRRPTLNSSTNSTPVHNPAPTSPEKHPRRSEEVKPDYARDWKRVAEVFDRLFFWICLLAILITTLLLFHPLTTSAWFDLKT